MTALAKPLFNPSTIMSVMSACRFSDGKNLMSSAKRGNPGRFTWAVNWNFILNVRHDLFDPIHQLVLHWELTENNGVVKKKRFEDWVETRGKGLVGRHLLAILRCARTSASTASQTAVVWICWQAVCAHPSMCQAWLAIQHCAPV